MKTWSAIFNLFAVVMIAFLLLIFMRVTNVSQQEFEALRLRYAVDYATEAAFKTTLSVEDIELDYTDIDNVTINPSSALETFEALICLSYNLSLSEYNFALTEESIATGVLFTNDGYYMLEMQEVDTTPDDLNEGGEYGLVWSLKKPYLVETNDYIYSTNIRTEQWKSVPKTGNLIIEDGQKWTDASRVTGLTRPKIQAAISKSVADDINYEIYMRNKRLEDAKKTPIFHLPSNESMLSVSSVVNPTMILFIQGADFVESGMKVDATSVGGTRVVRKRRVAGFIEGTQKYYCYEKQLPLDKMGAVLNFYESVEDAARAGYSPHFAYLGKEIRD